MKKNVFTSTSAAIVLAITFSCGKDYKAGSTVKSFVRDNFDERVFTDTDYRSLDSTACVTDSMIEVMRKNAGKMRGVSKSIHYANRKDKVLYYIPVRMETDGKEKVTHTFYMNRDLSEIVAFR